MSFQKQTVIPEDIFSPATSPRTQQRRMSYRFWQWVNCAGEKETDDLRTNTSDMVLPVYSTDSQTDEILHNGSDSKINETVVASQKFEEDSPKDILPTRSQDPKRLNNDECVIDVNDSDSRILKLLDVDDSTVSDSSSQMQNGEEARLEIDSKEGELSRESSEEDCCRICHNSQQYANDLVSPCNCSGSLGKMHISCLSQWLQLSKRQKCELCGYKYTFARESLKFIDFLRDPELRRTHRQLLWDLLSFALITPISVVSIILILLAGQQLKWHLSWDVIGLVTVGFAQLVAYTIWFRIAFQYHKRLWETWKNKNQVMKLVIKHRQAPKRQSFNVIGCISKRKNRIRGGRRSTNRANENLQSLRFFNRYTLNRTTFRRVH